MDGRWHAIFDEFLAPIAPYPSLAIPETPVQRAHPACGVSASATPFEPSALNSPQTPIHALPAHLPSPGVLSGGSSEASGLVVVARASSVASSAQRSTSAVGIGSTGGIRAAIATKPRPKRPGRHRQIKIFLSDPAVLSILGVEAPLTATGPVGLTARTLVDLVLANVRENQYGAVAAAGGLPDDSSFELVPANRDGTPDEDIRLAWAGEQHVSEECVLAVPRRSYPARAVVSHCRPAATARNHLVSFRVHVTHVSRPPQDANIAASTEAVARPVMLRLPADLLVGQMALTVAGRLLAKTNRVDCELEIRSFAVHYGGTRVVLACDPFFRFGTGGPWPVRATDLTVATLHDAGVSELSVATTSPYPAHMEHVDAPLVVAHGGAEAGGGLLGVAAAGPTLATMDELEAMKYYSFAVRKRNDRKVWQHRMFAVDFEFIYNLHSREGAQTKNPMRRIAHVQALKILPLDPRRCDVEYVSSSIVRRDELEFVSVAECRHFAAKIRILQRMATKDAEASRTSEPRATPGKTGVARDIFSRFFKKGS